MATHVAVEAIGRANRQPGAVDRTEFGKIICNEPRDGYLSRVATVGAGVPETAPTLTLNRLCGSGPQVVVSATDIMIGALTGPVG